LIIDRIKPIRYHSLLNFPVKLMCDLIYRQAHAQLSGLLCASVGSKRALSAPVVVFNDRLV